MENYIPNISELLGLLLAIIYYPHLKNSFMRWFLPFLVFIFLGELLDIYFSYVLNLSNVGLQYSIGMARSVFYGYIFYKLYNRNVHKKMILFFIYTSVVFYGAGLFFDLEDYNYFIPGLVLSGFFLALIALGYVYTKFADDDEMALIHDPGFWISFGVSLFFSGISIVFCLHDFIAKNNLTLFGIRLYNVIPRVLCILLYSSISIAIILCKKKNKILY